MKLKLIALAVAGMAAAGSANAVFDHPNDQSGDSELFLFAVDANANVQGFFDLGVNLSTWNPVSTQSAPSISRIWNLAANTTTGLGGVTGNWSDVWNQFAAASTVANSSFMVGGVDFDALGVALTTSNTPRSQIETQLDSNLQNMPVVDATLSGNTLVGNHASVVNGATFGTATQSPAGVVGSQFAPSWNGNFAGNAFDKIGTPQNAWLLTANFSGGFADVAQYGGQFNLSPAGVLSYTTPVPEPETYALMLAGLGMVAMIARRRRVQ